MTFPPRISSSIIWASRFHLDHHLSSYIKSALPASFFHQAWLARCDIHKWTMRLNADGSRDISGQRTSGTLVRLCDESLTADNRSCDSSRLVTFSNTFSNALPMFMLLWRETRHPIYQYQILIYGSIKNMLVMRCDHPWWHHLNREQIRMYLNRKLCTHIYNSLQIESRHVIHHRISFCIIINKIATEQMQNDEIAISLIVNNLQLIKKAYLHKDDIPELLWQDWF